MAVHSIHNLYRGINAHLHSLWQAESGWSGFHTNQISDLYKTLRAHLLPIGYDAEIEDSLQIRRIEGSVRNPRADVLVYDTNPTLADAAVPSAKPGAFRYPAMELLAEDLVSENPFRAIAIYRLRAEQVERGAPIAWIELLSPSNKIGDDAEIYHAKRMDVLHAGIVFVELDYLHETPPTLAALPNYRGLQSSKLALRPHPYRVIVIDPRPELAAGWGDVIPFHVDDPLPKVNIPLSGEDSLEFDLGLPYRKTFEESLYGRSVDYARFPLNFDHYSAFDQARIARRMLAVCEAVAHGDDPDTTPIELGEYEGLDLGAALQRLEALQLD